MAKESIGKYLVPARAVVDYDEATGERICYVSCRNGEALTVSLPYSWAAFISSAINRRYLARASNGYTVSDPICVLRLEGLPFQKNDSQIVARGKDDNFHIQDNPAYEESIRQAALLGENIFLQRWVTLPVDEPVTVSCIYFIKGKAQYVLPMCNAYILDLLDKLNIIKGKSQLFVRGMDASQFRHTKEPPYILVIIRKVEVKKK